MNVGCPAFRALDNVGVRLCHYRSHSLLIQTSLNSLLVEWLPKEKKLIKLIGLVQISLNNLLIAT